MSVEKAHQLLALAHGVVGDLQEQTRRGTAGHQAAQEAPPRSESSPQSNRYEATYQVGRAEEFDARSVWAEERPELENLVILGKGLCWSGAFNTETGNEECRKQEAADFRVGHPRLRLDDGKGTNKSCNMSWYQELTEKHCR